MHRTGRLGGEVPAAAGGRLVPRSTSASRTHLRLHLVEVRLERQDAADALEVDALVLRELLDVPQPGDVAQASSAVRGPWCAVGTTRPSRS